MTYYVMLPNDTEKSALTLGEESFGTFYPERGMEALLGIVNQSPELVSQVKIMDERAKTLTLTEFFDIIKDLKIRKM